VEAGAVENAKERYTTLAMLRREAASTLTILLAGIGGSLAYASKVLESGPAGPIAVGAAVLCVYLACIATGVVLRCLLVRDLPAIYNVPENLLIPGSTLTEVRYGNLDVLQAAITEMAVINAGIGKSLNALRVAAVASPVIFALAATIYQPKSTATQADGLKLQCKVLAQQKASDPQLACALAE
jgi:hypothetical protein